MRPKQHQPTKKCYSFRQGSITNSVIQNFLKSNFSGYCHSSTVSHCIQTRFRCPVDFLDTKPHCNKPIFNQFPSILERDPSPVLLHPRQPLWSSESSSKVSSHRGLETELLWPISPNDARTIKCIMWERTLNFPWENVWLMWLASRALWPLGWPSDGHSGTPFEVRFRFGKEGVA